MCDEPAERSKMKTISYGEHLVQLTRYRRLFPVRVYLVREDAAFTLIDTALSGG